jgi:hypothetical protein
VLTTGTAALMLAFAPAQAAVPDGTVAGTQQAAAEAPAGGTPELTVTPTTDLAPDGATIKVVGAGFADNFGDLYIAVCADGSTNLRNCVGGAVPAGNNTSAWAHISDDGQGPGTVTASWNDGGFDVTLALPSVAAGSPNCITGKCAIYASKSDGVPISRLTEALAFKAPASSSSSSSSPPPPPSPAVVQSISSPSIVAGGTQKIIFSGYRANEQVNLTLFSAPLVLSPVNADGTGVAQVEFVVPTDLEAGAHRLEAIGAESGTVGVATFQVSAPVVSSSSTPPSSSAPPSSSSESSSASSTSSSSVTSAPPVSSAAPTSTAIAPASGDSGNSLWWLWLIIGIVLVAGIITAIVVYRRKQQEQRERDEQEVTDAAAREQTANQPPPAGYGADAPTVFLPPVQPTGPPPGADPYGLLSGRDHPDGPPYYSGQDPAGPTEVLGPQGYQPGPGPYGQPLGYGGPERGFPATPEQPGPPAPGALGSAGGPGSAAGPGSAGGPGGPPTEALPPATQAQPGRGSEVDGPGTQAWAPDFDDSDPDDGAPGHRDGGQGAGPADGGST